MLPARAVTRQLRMARTMTDRPTDERGGIQNLCYKHLNRVRVKGAQRRKPDISLRESALVRGAAWRTASFAGRQSHVMMVEESAKTRVIPPKKAQRKSSARRSAQPRVRAPRLMRRRVRDAQILPPCFAPPTSPPQDHIFTAIQFPPASEDTRCHILRATI